MKQASVFSKGGGKLFKLFYITTMFSLVFNMSYLGVFFVIEEVEAGTVDPDWPGCIYDNNCTANDFDVISVYLGDCSTGLEPNGCTLGDVVDTCVWADFEAKNDRAAITLLADLHVDGSFDSDVDSCLVDSVSKGYFTEKIDNIAWTCGDEIELKNILIAWGLKGETCSDTYGFCDEYITSKCDGESSDIRVAAPLVAGLSADPVCDGYAVSFDGNATGGTAPYTYSWDFGDSSVSTDENPSHTYASAGTYTVSLTVTDSDTNTDTQTMDVDIYAGPSADFTATPVSGDDPLIVVFVDASTQGSGAITDRQWSFGDSGFNAYGSMASHEYSEGVYSPSLTITDENGCSDTEEKLEYISVTPTKYCGDGIVNNDEECDDGNNTDGDGCSATCVDEYCGDGVVNDINEHCDDGNDSNVDECTNSCTLTYCGDDIVQYPNGDGEFEECDGDAGVSDHYTCTELCTLEYVPYCGDGNIDSGEQCDDGNNVNGDGCDSSCVSEYCGDELTNDSNEECDDGKNGDNTDGCTDACTLTYCGDNIVQYPNGYLGYEDCDGDAPSACMIGGYNGLSTCTNCTWSECVPQEKCGDGIVNNGEECDDQDGLPNEHYTCTNSCTLKYIPYCGDQTLDPGEGCDDGNNTDGDGCNASCVAEYCGDGIDNNGDNEACDDGANGDNTDGCTDSCTLTYCGDDIVQYLNGDGGYEDCDGDAPDTCVTQDGYNGISTCTDCGWSSCVPQEWCGDDIVNNGEACDGDAGVSDHYTCTNSCTLEYVPYCGDGNLDSGEDCDDGANGDDTDGCTDACTLTYCGDNIVQSLNGDGRHEDCDGDEPRECLVDGGYHGLSTCTNCTWSECISQESCGDGIVNDGEECDDRDGLPSEHHTCTDTCTLEYIPYCGDNNVDPGEECDGDAGLPNEHYTCTDSCTEEYISYCGDGTCDGNETCSTCSSDCGSCSSGGGSTPLCILRGDCGGSTPAPTPISTPDTIEAEEEVIVLGDEGAPMLVFTKEVNQSLANPGDILNYSLLITNNGNLDAFNVLITDELPEGLTFVKDDSSVYTWEMGDIPAGESRDAHYQVKVLEAIEAGNYLNTAVASADNHDDVSTTAEVEVIIPVVLAETGMDFGELAFLFVFSTTAIIASRKLKVEFSA